MLASWASVTCIQAEKAVHTDGSYRALKKIPGGRQRREYHGCERARRPWAFTRYETASGVKP